MAWKSECRVPVPVRFAICANTLGKGWYPSLPLQAISQLVGFFFCKNEYYLQNIITMWNMSWLSLNHKILISRKKWTNQIKIEVKMASNNEYPWLSVCIFQLTIRNVPCSGRRVWWICLKINAICWNKISHMGLKKLCTHI